jgi:hypothetical protein
VIFLGAYYVSRARVTTTRYPAMEWAARGHLKIATDNEEHSIGGARPQTKSAEWERPGAGAADRIR